MAWTLVRETLYTDYFLLTAHLSVEVSHSSTKAGRLFNLHISSDLVRSTLFMICKARSDIRPRSVHQRSNGILYKCYHPSCQEALAWYTDTFEIRASVGNSRATNQMARHLAILLSRFITLTFRALGRNHIASHCPGAQSNGYPQGPVKWDRLQPNLRFLSYWAGLLSRLQVISRVKLTFLTTV